MQRNHTEDSDFSFVVPSININGSVINLSPEYESSKSPSHQEQKSSQNRDSICSTASTINSLYSSGDFFHDEEIQSSTPDLEVPSHTLKRDRLKELLVSNKVKPSKVVHSNVEDQQAFEEINEIIENDIQTEVGKNEKLNIDWQHMIEIYLFGGRLESVLEYNLINYLLNSNLEGGRVKFQPLDYSIMPSNLKEAMKSLLYQVDDFNGIINSYKQDLSGKDSSIFRSEKTFNELVKFVEIPGFSLPMAQTLFGTWLLTFARRGENVNDNYNDVRIMNQFRKAARMALVVKKLSQSGFFDSVMKQFPEHERNTLNRIFTKDNDFALSTSLFSIAEYYQHAAGFDTAINYWEINAHVTGDIESCNMAIWGLTDGFGIANKVKKFKLGSGEKRRKYNTKRRIAHLYRIIHKNGGRLDVGASWVFKEKYD